MTREERTKLIKHLKYNRNIGADYLITDNDADEIIKALEQESSGDAISRQTVMYALCDGCELFHRNGEETCLAKCESYHFLATLPPVTPQPKTGHWIVHEHAEEFYGRVVDNYECDNCGDWYLNKTNFCPNCGAKMLRIPIGSESEVEE